jgi:uncharacterized protein (DUF1684 family)
MNDAAYRKKIEKFREEQNKEMTGNPLNWLSLVGLFWLEEGDNSFGSGGTNAIVLPAQACEQCGILHLENGKVTLLPAPGSGIKLNGRTPEARPLRTDKDGEPDLIEIVSLTMTIIKRGDLRLLRVWDKESPEAKNFRGLKFYPIKPEYCLEAKFIPYDPPKIIKTLDMLGIEHDTKFSGQARFTLNGVEYNLEAEESGKELLFSFNDKTKEDATYPGGRKFTIPKPQSEWITLDFNLAENWPCAYTSFATCPIPPRENHLDVRIEAGEMKYYESH